MTIARRLTAFLAAAAALALAGPALAWSPPAQNSFADVLPATAFYTQIEGVYAAGIMTGYSCGGPGEPCDALNRPYFRQFDDVTRGQLAKVVAAAADLELSNPPAQGTFEDVLPGSAYYAPIEALSASGLVTGYACGGSGEPCDALNRPYFRQFNDVTRGQVAKVVAPAAGLDVANPPAQATFADVPPNFPFYAPIEALAAAGAVSGYVCGGPGEPCDALNRPYFRPFAYVTRGQLAKIVAQALVFSDTTAPALTVPAPIAAEATSPAGAAVAFAVSATDPDDPVRATTCAPVSGATFPLGSTTVTCIAADTHLNDATATFVVTVADTTPPAFAGVPGPVVADATTPSGALVAYAMPTATDLVDGAVAVGCSPSSGALFPIGTSIVLCRAVDAHGNVAKASFKVLVNGALVQLDALIKKVSGTSFATPLLTAKTYLQKSDLVDGCAQLSEFDREVLGASLLKPYQASSWLAVSAQIETVAGCKR